MWDSRPRLSGRAKLDSRCRSDPSKFLSFRTKRGICFSPRTTTAQGEPPSAVRSSATRQPLPLRSLKILVIPNEERNLLFAADHHRPCRDSRPRLSGRAQLDSLPPRDVRYKLPVKSRTAEPSQPAASGVGFFELIPYNPSASVARIVLRTFIDILT